MSLVFTTNVLLPALGDKFGQLLIALKTALVASGRWRVRGSGDGKAAFQLMGQTGGIAGSFDVFTASPAWSQDTSAYNAARNNSITQPRAWLLLEEIASGRVLLAQRVAYNGGANESISGTVAVATAVASSGATANTPPVLTGNSAFLAGNAWNDNGNNSPQFCDGAFGDFAIGSTHQGWLQIGVETAARAGNVSPWYFAVWNRTTGTRAMGAIWESLTDVDVGQTHPLACAFGAWSRVFGTIGNGSTGPIHAGSAWRGGDTLALCTLGYQQLVGIGATPPAYQQAGNDGKFRTERPWVLVPSIGSRLLGRLEHAYLNKVSREYPTTYNVLDAEARLTLGHLIVPWQTGIIPSSSP